MRMNQLLTTLTVAVCGLAPTLTWANLIVNGGFETPLVTNSGPPAGMGFDYRTGTQITGWTITGSKEVHFTPAYNPVGGGNQTVQLESTSDFFQTFATMGGAQYTLTFDYGAWDMSNRAVFMDAPLEVKIDGLIVATVIGTNQLYQTHSLTFIADDSSTTLAFRNAGVFAQDWAQVDNVSVVPEPGSLALLGLGLVGLAALRRKKT